jgi:hypothetical protein
VAVAIDSVALSRVAQWDSIGSAAIKIAESIDDPHFPGAIFAAINSDGRAVFYGLADCAASWRRLQPLLIAFVGATFTGFDGMPAELDESDPVEGFLLSANLYAVALLRPGVFPKATEAVLRSLLSLRNAVDRAPDLSGGRIEPTPTLLARLQDALNAGDLDSAWTVHRVLNSELRLDALNLLQLEFQIRSAGGDWMGIRSHSDFEWLCASGPSPATAELLLEAIYWVDIAGKNQECTKGLDESVMTLGYSLLKFIGPSSSPVIKEMSALIRGTEDGKDAKDISAAETLTASEDKLARAHRALLAFGAAEHELNSLAEMEAVTAVNLLDEADREQLLSRPMFKAAWSEIAARLGDSPPPLDWSGWFVRLDDHSFDAASYARRGVSDWCLRDEEVDPATFQVLAESIINTPDGLAGDRLNQSLPYLVDWVASDPQWPRVSLCPVYLSLLMRIALSTRRGETMIKSAAVLLESALRCGLSQREYRDAMESVGVIASEALNRNTAYDVFELVDVANNFSATDEVVLGETLSAVVASASRLFDRLSPGQKLACARIASQIGWEDCLLSNISNPVPEIAVKLSNLTVGIYTLTETAGRNARSILASIQPEIKVELNHDHDATSALSALVGRADLFVIAWASAKHAATNFIKSRRGSKPLVYALGKGASSLIRAVEDYSSTMKPSR